MEAITKLSIVGSGQIGTSIALKAALVHQNMEIVCYDNNPDAREEFYIRLSLFSFLGERIKFTSDPKDVEGSDIVVMATPLSEFGKAIKSIAPYVGSNAVFTDVGSVKYLSMKRIRGALDQFISKDVQFVPFHILNGTSGAGAKTARPDIMEAPGVLVPDQASPEAEETVCKFLRSLGVDIQKMTAKTHDKIMGTTSHLQHAIVFALMQTDVVSDLFDERCLTDHGNWISARTRIAEADPIVWADICIDNKDEMIETFSGLKRTMLDWLDRLDDGENITRSRINCLHEYASDKPSGRITKFDYDEVFPDDADALRGLICFLSVALTANAKRVEIETGQKLTPIATPSFKDGIGPVAIDPESVRKAMLRVGTPRMRVIVATDFIRRLNELEGFIKNGDGASLKSYIDLSKEQHKQLSPVFLHPEAPKISRQKTPKPA